MGINDGSRQENFSLNVIGIDVSWDLHFGLVVSKPEHFVSLLERGWFVTFFAMTNFVTMASTN